MTTASLKRSADSHAALIAVLLVMALSLLVQHDVDTRRTLLFLTGVGLGVTLLHAAFGFTGGWRRLYLTGEGRVVRAQILLLALTSLLFFPLLGDVFPGLSVNGATGIFGVAVLVGAFMFGIGMQLAGGCGSGTLFTVGGGNVGMLIVLIFFILGSFVATAHVGWWWALPNIGKPTLIAKLGWLPALLLQMVVFALLYAIVRHYERKRRGRVATLQEKEDNRPVLDRLIFGNWPLWWAVVGIAVLNLVTLLLSGHPWTITFAFGLWGAKIFTALGGDVSNWDYWSGGYAARALASSVLADETSLMDFGIILGAMLAAALAGKYAPDRHIDRKRIMLAIAGGFLMGYGARLAFGCNIGGMMAGIVSGSLHGWLWLLAGFTGSLFGLRMRAWLGVDRPRGKQA